MFRIPSEPTLNQRFGILVHQVLERFHQGGAAERSLPELLGLLEAGWRRGGFGDSEEERQLRAKATHALLRYHERWQEEEGEPVWFERAFAFHLGPHLLRGRVDRVDRLPDGRYELIDYKTGRPKTPAQLRDDVQLALYAVAATQAWSLDASVQSYLYVLDDEKVPLPADAGDAEWIAETVLDVADGILGQGFEHAAGPVQQEVVGRGPDVGRRDLAPAVAPGHAAQGDGPLERQGAVAQGGVEGRVVANGVRDDEAPAGRQQGAP